ncbi:MAG: YebC/PmpR family DNA-binding transcriptional regulator [Patescibacteria group bacterium]
MSGHSKWSQIKRQKGSADQKRGTLFTKCANRIIIAARRGGGDPATNFQLRLAIDLARSANMPKDNIERAIKRGTGELEGQVIEEVLYEGFGPAGVGILVESLTDSKNRTVSFLRSTFIKHGGNLGGPGSVNWMFAIRGVVRLERAALADKDLDALQFDALDHGAQDVRDDPEGWTILTDPKDLPAIKEFFEQRGLPILEAGLEWIPTSPQKNLSPESVAKLERLVETLESSDDVDRISVTYEH